MLERAGWIRNTGDYLVSGGFAQSPSRPVAQLAQLARGLRAALDHVDPERLGLLQHRRNRLCLRVGRVAVLPE